MSIRAILSLTLLGTLLAFNSMGAAAQTTATPMGDSQMMTPPPVSGQAYPTEVGAEAKSNYLNGGISFTGGYVENLFPGDTSAPTNAAMYSVTPTLSFDQESGRQHRMFTYSPSFTFYQPSNDLNMFNQSARANYQYRLTPHATVVAGDSFVKTSDVFEEASATLVENISGSTQISTPGVIVPFANQLSNAANAELTTQMSRSSMIGVSGFAANMDYPNSSGAGGGVYNSSSRGGGAFYNHQISGAQYMGVNYQYAQSAAQVVNTPSETRMDTVSAFYTIYFRRALSISVSGGPQYFNATETGAPTTSSWTPSVTASMGWQAFRSNLAVSYSQAVTGGGGLMGAYYTKSANASVRWQLSRIWTAAAGASYASSKSATPLLLFANLGGHTISGLASVQRSITQQLRVSFEYDRMHENYGEIAAIASNPDTDRVSAALSWYFTQPVGR
jgi:hypothetical protein